MMRSTRRPRPSKPVMTFRVLLAATALVFSTGELANRISGNGGLAVRSAHAAYGPQDFDGFDRGSVHQINRAAKSDVRVLRIEDIKAGYLTSASLFAPGDLPPPNRQMAFIPRNDAVETAAPTRIAAIPVKEKAEAGEELKSAGPAGTVGTKTEAGVIVAYAPASDATADVPFDAVIANGSLNPAEMIPNAPVTHAWVNKPIPASAKSESELKCLATAIYFEARGEPEDGQLAVAQVVINRLKNPAYPNTICGVVYQNKHRRNRCQFSFACDGRSDRITDMTSWKEAQELAQETVDQPSETFLADVGSSTHYHATYVNPRWARRMTKADKIGRHIFYNTRYGGWN